MSLLGMGSRGAANDVVAVKSEWRLSGVVWFRTGLLTLSDGPLSPQNDPKANCERAKALSFRV